MKGKRTRKGFESSYSAESGATVGPECTHMDREIEDTKVMTTQKMGAINRGRNRAEWEHREDSSCSSGRRQQERKSFALKRNGPSGHKEPQGAGGPG